MKKNYINKLHPDIDYHLSDFSESIYCLDRFSGNNIIRGYVARANFW